jgi:hypothetical protein
LAARPNQVSESEEPVPDNVAAEAVAWERGQASVRVGRQRTRECRGQVARPERTEIGTTSQITRLVHDLGLAEERIATGRVRGHGVTVVAPALCIDDDAAFADERRIETFHVERDRRHVGASLDLACTLSRQRDDCALALTASAEPAGARL